MDKVKLELIRIARDLCFTEYTDRRAQVHNKWLVESEHLWRTQRLRLAYPDMPEYPSEADIMNRAERLFEYVNRDTDVTASSVDNQVETDSQTQVIEAQVITTQAPDPEPVNTECQVENTVSQPQDVIELNPQTIQSSGGSGNANVEVTPRTSLERRLEAEAKLMELIKEQAKLQNDLGSVTQAKTSTARLIPGVLNKLNEFKNQLGPASPPKGGS